MMDGKTLVICAICFIVGFIIGAVAARAKELEQLTRDEEQRAVQLIQQTYGADAAKCKALIDEVQGFALNIDAKIESLSYELQEIVKKVTSKM